MSTQVPVGTGVVPVPGEPTEAEWTERAARFARTMGVPEDAVPSVAAIIAGGFAGAYRHGYWAGRHAGEVHDV